MLDPASAFHGITPDDGITLSMLDGRLLVTCAPERLHVCRDCPDLHVLMLEDATAATLRTLAAGLLHMAAHAR